MRVDLAPALAVEADGGEVGQDHPAAVVELGQIAKGLLDGGKVAVPALLGIQIRTGSLEFNDDTGDVLLGAKESEASIRGAGALDLGRGGFGFEIVSVEVPDSGSKTEQAREDVGQELPLEGLLVQVQKRGICRCSGPLIRDGSKFRGQDWSEAGQAASQEIGAEQGFEKVWHRVAVLRSVVSQLFVGGPRG